MKPEQDIPTDATGIEFTTEEQKVRDDFRDAAGRAAVAVGKINQMTKGNARGPRPTPLPVSPRKKKRRAVAKARRANR